MVPQHDWHEPAAVSKAASPTRSAEHPEKRAKRCRNGKPTCRLRKLFTVQPGVQPAVWESSSAGHQQEASLQARSDFILRCKASFDLDCAGPTGRISHEKCTAAHRTDRCVRTKFVTDAASCCPHSQRTKNHCCSGTRPLTTLGQSGKDGCLGAS